MPSIYGLFYISKMPPISGVLGEKFQDNLSLIIREKQKERYKRWRQRNLELGEKINKALLSAKTAQEMLALWYGDELLGSPPQRYKSVLRHLRSTYGITDSSGPGLVKFIQLLAKKKNMDLSETQQEALEEISDVQVEPHVYSSTIVLGQGEHLVRESLGEELLELVGMEGLGFADLMREALVEPVRERLRWKGKSWCLNRKVNDQDITKATQELLDVHGISRDDPSGWYPALVQTLLKKSGAAVEPQLLSRNLSLFRLSGIGDWWNEKQSKKAAIIVEDSKNIRESLDCHCPLS